MFKFGNYNVASYLYKIDYNIFKKKETLEDICVSAYYKYDYKSYIYYYNILLKDKEFIQSINKDKRNLYFYYYLVSLYQDGQSDKFKKQYIMFKNSYIKEDYTTRIRLINIIKFNEYFNDEYLIFAENEYLNILQNISKENKRNVIVYNALSQIYSRQGNVQLSIKYKKLLTEYLEKYNK